MYKESTSEPTKEPNEASYANFENEVEETEFDNSYTQNGGQNYMKEGNMEKKKEPTSIKKVQGETESEREEKEQGHLWWWLVIQERKGTFWTEEKCL